MKLTGKQTWVFENPLFVNAAGTAAGPKEKTARSVRCLIRHTMKCIAIRKTGKWRNVS